jgi:hypothetical protein
MLLREVGYAAPIEPGGAERARRIAWQARGLTKKVLYDAE